MAGMLLLAACAHSTGDAILRSKNLIEVQGQYDQAIQILEAEAARNPSSAAVWYWLGIGRYKKGDFDNASKSLERAFDLNLYKTYHLSAYEYLGWSYLNTDKYDRAVETFIKALAIDPDMSARSSAAAGPPCSCPMNRKTGGSTTFRWS
jgi:tetratricopeptide (TPR) repeat protein